MKNLISEEDNTDGKSSSSSSEFEEYDNENTILHIWFQ